MFACLIINVALKIWIWLFASGCGFESRWNFALTRDYFIIKLNDAQPFSWCFLYAYIWPLFSKCSNSRTKSTNLYFRRNTWNSRKAFENNNNKRHHLKWELWERSMFWPITFVHPLPMDFICFYLPFYKLPCTL